MAVFALFLVAAAPVAAPVAASTEHAAVHDRSSASASVSVVIVRAERVSATVPPDGARRQVRRRGDTLLVEFN